MNANKTFSEAVREHKAAHPAPTQNFPSPYGKPFKSMDPTWPKWAVSPKVGNTRWFNTKAEAEEFIRTGDDSKAINK